MLGKLMNIRSNVTTFKARKILITTAVWGDWHLQKFLDTNIPTLLAKNNLPSLAKDFNLTYKIFTRKKDKVKLSKHISISLLKELGIKIQIVLLSDDLLVDPIAAHHGAWQQGVDTAIKSKSLILFMPPDVIWSSNSFLTVSNLLKAGNVTIFMNYLRATSNMFEEAFPSNLNGEPIEISGRELVGICLKSLHPLMAASFRQSQYFPVHPELVIWPIPGEGVTVRNLARELFLYDPSALSTNQAALPEEGFNPSKSTFITDSDDLFAVSLAEIGKDTDWFIDRRPLNIFTLSSWWIRYDSISNDFVSNQKIRWHFNKVSENKWRATETGADLLLYRARVGREMIRFWQYCQIVSAKSVGKVAVVLNEVNLLPHLFNFRNQFLIVVPSDASSFPRFISKLTSKALTEKNASRELLQVARKFVYNINEEKFSEKLFTIAHDESFEFENAYSKKQITLTRTKNEETFLDGKRCWGISFYSNYCVIVVDDWSEN